MKTLSAGEKIGYGVGDVASNVIWNMVMFFLPIFYTDTFGIPAAVVGTMFIVVRLFDAINDPVMGVIADRTETRWGKYRPYILWSAIPYGIGGILMFLTPALSFSGKIVYAYATYILMMIIYTVIMVPYNALSGVMTSNFLDRTSLNAYRFIGAFIGALFIQGLSVYCVNTFGAGDQSIIIAELQNHAISIQEKGVGTAKVTVQARDVQGAETSYDFLVQVNRPGEMPPAVERELDDIQLPEHFSEHTLDVSDVFRDIDSEKLHLSVESSADPVVNASISGQTLVLRETGIGNAVITIKADDGQGGVTSESFVATVIRAGNSTPVVVDSLKDLTLYAEFKDAAVSLENLFGLYEEEKYNISQVFHDPDQDNLFYTASSSNPSVVSAIALKSSLFLKKKSPGKAVITLRADDNQGGIVSLNFDVVVNPGENSNPMLKTELSDLQLQPDFSEQVIDISELFQDAENDSLTCSIAVNNDAKGYVRTMAVFAIFSVILFLITFASTRERIKPIAKQKPRFKDDLKDLLKNQPWMILFVVTILTQTYVSIRSAVIAYYFRYYVGDFSLVSTFLVSGTIAIILVLLITKWLTRLFGKRNLYLGCMVIVGITLSMYQFVSPNQIVLIFVLQIVQAIASAPTIPLLWSMYADTSDYSEWKTGRKAMGLAYSASTFGMKSGTAIGGALALWLLSYFGYQSNVEQTQTSLNGIRMMMGLYPGIGAFVCAFFIGFYKLDTKTMTTIEEDLNKQRINSKPDSDKQ